MNEIITEKIYPIEGIWVVKSITGSLLYLLILVPFYLSGSRDTEFNVYIILVILGIPIYIIYAYLRKKTFHYFLESQFLILQQGILSKQQRYIPYGVMQNVYIKQDLLDRVFGLAWLILENASEGGKNRPEGRQIDTVGFSGNKVSIPGLTKQNAEILKGIILQKIKENPVVNTQSGL